MIIDVHAHCGSWYFPSEITESAQVSKLCDIHDIHRIVFSSSLAILYDMVEGNHQTSKFIEEDERFRGYVYLDPSQAQRSGEEIARYEDNLSFVGFKMHPSYSGENPDSQNTFEMMERLPDGAKILIHTWAPDGVKSVCRLASRFPHLSIIMGHMGGTQERDWRAGIEGARVTPNTYLEICGSLLHRDRIADAVKAIGSERILYGSDTTLISPAWSIGQVMGSNIRDEDRRNILFDNATRLFEFT
ncbi:MAG: amidohydrolase family protein [Theionarchaea archaeon]|nr:amidohydrolase family protein [Theionarchaea archaeon]